MSLNPDQFTSVYRSEHRPPESDLDNPGSVGVHWTTKPLDFGYAHEPGHKRVVWHGKVSAEHVADTSDRFNEGEVVLHSGGQVHLTGRTERLDQFGTVDVDKSGSPETPMNSVVPVKGRQIK